MKRIFITFGLFIGIIPFAYSLAFQKPLLSPTTSLRLGDGYVTYDHMGVGETPLRLSDTQITYGDMQNSINLTQTIDRNELAKALNTDFSASGGWGPFSASASANFLKHTENTQFSENFSYAERYYVNALLDISHLPASAKAFTPGAEELYKKSGMAAFNLRYGDAFIKELPLGAFLAVNLRLTFSTALDKDKFDGSLGGGFGSIFEASAKIQRDVTRSNAHGVIEVSAYQLGGNPEELASIFSKKQNDGYYITTCSLENLKDCQGAIDGIISYAINNFSKQIAPKDKGTRPEGNLVVVGEPIVDSYTQKFMLEPSAPLDPTIVLDRLELATLYNSLKVQKIFFDHYAYSPVSGFFTTAGNKLIKETQQNITWNASLFEQFGAIFCYLPGREHECREVIDNIKKYTKPVDQKVIDFYMNTAYFETNASCMYVPVDVPNKEIPIFADLCGGQWINGIFTFKMTEDKNKLEVTEDYYFRDAHIVAEGTATPFGSYLNYTGMVYYHNHNTNRGGKYPVSFRLIQNKA